MSQLEKTNDIFFNRFGLDQQATHKAVTDTLSHMEDGELFLEYRQAESFSFDDNQLKNAVYDTSQGFGLRAVSGEAIGYAHASDLDMESLKRASQTVATVHQNYAPQTDVTSSTQPTTLYPDLNPLEGVGFESKIQLLQDINAYARAKDPRVKQVSISLAGSWQAVQIIRPDGSAAADIRPLVRLNVSVILGQGDRQEAGSYGVGGRAGYDQWITPDQWHHQVDEAFRQAEVNLDSRAAPAGEMPVILGPGWPGILLHEAVGHGLEGDFNRKKTSAFAGLLGQRVAAPGVTVIDDGTIQDRRGSITIDDEGTKSQKNVLIEDGILKGYMQDRQNARLMGVAPTGNGRRESYAHAPLPRMTNTYMLGGDQAPEEILKSVKNGLYAVNFGGGQVDITSGKFVFSCTEAYLIEDGKVTAPVKGATLIGNGPDAMTKIKAIGNDMSLDPGIGTCGKDGQGVPVGVGQPTLRIDGLTVGGTAA